ncbi:MAG: PD-(D/E)XK nuclease family protein [candidate division WOR-3 bacterium]
MNKKRKLFLFPFNCYNSTELLFRAALATGAQPQEILYLTPSPRKLRATQVLFARLWGRKAFVPPVFRTLGQLAREICDYTSDKRLFPDELKPLLIKNLFVEKGKKITLAYARAIGDFVADVKRHVPREKEQDIPTVLKETLAGYEKPLRRALDAWYTLTLYNATLEKHGSIDNEDSILEAANHISDYHPSPRILILDSFVAPNNLEEKFLSALVENAEMTFAGTYFKEGDRDYALGERFVNFFSQSPGLEIEEVKVDFEPPNPPLYKFPNPEEEIIGIARNIRSREEDTNLAETYIVFPRLSDYAPLITRILPQYSIPFTIYPRTTLSSSPPIVCVLELLRALDTDYERIATCAALSSPYLPYLLRLPDDKDERGRNLAAQSLNYLSRRAGIIKGKDNWLNIANRIFAQEETEPEDWERNFLLELQTRVRQAIGLTEKILEPAGTIGNQARRLKQFLKTAEFCSNISPEQPWFEQLRLDRKSLYDILDAIAIFAAEFGEQKDSRSSFIKTLSYLIGLKIKTPESDRGGVTVVKMEETLGLNPTNLYFAGLTETDLPGSYHPDPILPDSVRKKLGMPDIEWHRDWQRFHFRRTLESSPNTPFLSYHESRNGKPVLRTPFIETEPVKYHDGEIIFSEVEEQIYRGRQKHCLFEDVILTVDFSGDEEIKQELNRRFGANAKFHVTTLESYLRCPYQFYLYNILGLKTPPEPTFEIDARMWGSIAHRILARIYQEGPIPVEDIGKIAGEIIDQELNNITLPAFWREVTYRILKNLFVKLVEYERELRADGFQPVKTEKRVYGSIKPDINLLGRIDRIDRKNNLLRIIDYKTGSPDINAHAHIQLPLYAYLLSQDEEFQNLQIENMGIYSLRSVRLKFLANKNARVEELIKAAIERTVNIVADIRKGKFLAAPSSLSNCENCDFHFTCGKEAFKDAGD